MYKESYVNLMVFTTKTQDNATKKIVLFNNYLLPPRATLVITYTKVKSGDRQK